MVMRIARILRCAQHLRASILGRHLREDETVRSINAYPARLAPGEARDAAYRRLLEFGDKLAQRVKHVPEEEIDAAIDEAVDHVRHHPECGLLPIPAFSSEV